MRERQGGGGFCKKKSHERQGKRKTHTDQPPHRVQLFAIAAPIELFLQLSLGLLVQAYSSSAIRHHPRSRGGGGHPKPELARVLRDGLLQAHAEARGVLGERCEVWVRGHGHRVVGVCAVRLGWCYSCWIVCAVRVG